MWLEVESDEDHDTGAGRSCRVLWALGKDQESLLNAMVGPQSILRKKVPGSAWNF